MRRALVPPWLCLVVVLCIAPTEPLVAQETKPAAGAVASPTASPEPGPTLSLTIHEFVLTAGAVVLVLLAIATVTLFGFFVFLVSTRMPLGTRGHWGGFGGAASGWELSPALALLVAALVLAVVTAGMGAALVTAVMKPHERTTTPSAPPSAGKPAAGATAK